MVVIISFLDTTHCPFLLFPLKGDDWTTVFKTEITVVESNFEIKIEKRTTGCFRESTYDLFVNMVAQSRDWDQRCHLKGYVSLVAPFVSN